MLSLQAMVSPRTYNSVCNMFWILNLQSWTKVLGHFRVSGAFSNSHRSNPSSHPTNGVARVYPEFFPSFNFVSCGGGGRTARKFWKVCTALRGNREMTEKYEFCSTVPRGFVQDCRLVTMSRKSDHVTRYWPYRGVGTCAFSSPKPLGLICNRPVAKKRRALRTRMVRVLQC